jgi:hypothetical protein
VIEQLPHCVWPRCPKHHLGERVVFRRRGLAIENGVNGRITDLLERSWEEMHQAVEGYAGHYVDEETVTCVNFMCDSIGVGNVGT